MSRLRTVRELVGITRKELGALADLHPAEIADLESGRRRGRPDTWKKVASALMIDDGVVSEQRDAVQRQS